ncbi:MAG: DivIVA domain-containing protein [Clostridia bacterium]|jgi:cell division septum initiation protein DivIVA|nr:DivIVA domain-containing protein [Clostridia bacterium]
MANELFSMQQEGYNTEEVDNYINMLQQEYRNAIAWGEEMEAKLNELETSLKEKGMYFTLQPDNKDEVVASVFMQLTETVNQTKAAAQEKAEEILAHANEKSRGIVRQAMENSVQIRTENNMIMDNLRSIKDMIEVVLEKGIQ